MSGWQAISDWFAKASLVLDPYERQARLFPALLCVLPLMVMCIALYPNQLISLKGLGGLVGCVGLMYLLADFARGQGRKHEARLWASWGGAPSVQVLRHRDHVFDPVSKSIYHNFLGKKLKIAMPSKETEATDPDLADAAYAAAGNWLRSATRDKKKFNLLYRDNVTYGYRRNGYGLRWVGVVVSLAVLVWVGFREGFSSWWQRLDTAATPESLLSAGEVVTGGVAIVMIFIWQFNFSESRVRDAAFSYARQLILCCESLPGRLQTTKAKAAPEAN